MLELKNVSYSYVRHDVRVDAVKNVSYTFEPGRFYAIMGPSGSGKSTLMHLIGALARPDQGDILYCGKPISAIPGNEYRLKHVSLIYQNFCLLPFMNILDNVIYPATLLGIPRKQALEEGKAQLRKLGLDASYEKRRPDMLSGGEQQRVAIARAMCTGTEVLTADEPTGNLDSANAQLIGDIFCRLAHEEGKTVIMVTHDAAMAERADIVLRMKDGVIQPPED